MQLGSLRQESAERDGAHTPPDHMAPEVLSPEVLAAAGGAPTQASPREVLAQTYKKYGKLEDTPAGKEILGSHGHLNELLPTLNEKVVGLLRGQEKVFGTFGSQIVQEAHTQLNDARATAETAKSMAARCGIPPSDPAFFKARRLEAELERYMVEAVRLHKLSQTYRAEIEQWRAKVEELQENRPGLTSVIKSARRQNHLFEAVVKEVDSSSGAFELGDWTDALKRRRPASEPAKQAQGPPASEPAKQAQGRSSLLFQPSTSSSNTGAVAGASSQRSDGGDCVSPAASLREQLVQRMPGGAPSPRPPEDGRSPLTPPAQPPPLPPTRLRPPLSSRPGTSEKSQAGVIAKLAARGPRSKPHEQISGEASEMQDGQAKREKTNLDWLDQKLSTTSGKGSMSARAAPQRPQQQTSREAPSLENEQEPLDQEKKLAWLDKRISALAGHGAQESGKSNALGDLLQDAALREAGTSGDERKYIKQINFLEDELRKMRRAAQQARARQASHFTRRQTLEEFFLRCIEDLRRDVTHKKGLVNPGPRPSTCGPPRQRGPPRADRIQTSQGISKDSCNKIPEMGVFECHSNQSRKNSEKDAVVEVLLGSEVLLVHLYKTLFPHRDYYHVDGNRPNHQIFQPYKGRKRMSADKVSDNEPLPSLSETSYEWLVLRELKNKRWGFVS
mmetsp:Transcript_113187/g.196287  ORF Transcript_113187/g.196287 Transcript_113187/m.196287 type:complete len:674 (-) Transcript_113187:83-2104(-)